jgi:ribonuclease D
MTEYALNDTRFLLRLCDIFTARLTELGRWVWFEQSCERAIAAAAVIKERDPETVWRVSGSSELTDRGNAILRALWHWRDQEAQQVDRPAFHILHNEQLVDAASRLDRGQGVQFPHLRGSRLRRFEDAGVEALALPADQWPRLIRKSRPRPSPDQDARFRALREKRDKVAGNLQLDPSLIAPKATLERLAADGAEAAATLMPWQREALELK